MERRNGRYGATNSRRLATEAAAAAPPSDLPFEYQPYSAFKAGLPISPGFEHISIKEFERSAEETRRISRNEID